jgi:putative flippase GtrA
VQLAIRSYLTNRRAGFNVPLVARFVAVGTAGNVANCAVFSLAIFAGALPRIAAVLAFVAVNVGMFIVHRRWTFSSQGAAARQGVLYVAVTLMALAANLALLPQLDAHMPVVLAQYVAVCLAALINFAGNYSLTFRRAD